jgi:large subunit ribosomal protein L32
MPNLSKCSNCGAVKLPHKICHECGFYNGKLIMPKKVKKSAESVESSDKRGSINNDNRS